MDLIRVYMFSVQLDQRDILEVTGGIAMEGRQDRVLEARKRHSGSALLDDGNILSSWDPLFYSSRITGLGSGSIWEASSTQTDDDGVQITERHI